MKLLGNLLWLIFGGFITCIEYLVSSLFLMITIVGIPFGLQTLKMASVTLMPFNYTVNDGKKSSGFLNLIMNIIWILVGGIWISLTHILFGVLLAITVIGMPFAKQHFKMAALSLAPFGKTIKRK